MERTYKEAVKIVVDLWIKHSFDTLNNQNIGEGGMVQNLLNVNSHKSQGDINQQQRQSFEERLTHLLLINQEDNNCDVDYNPSDYLFDACRFAKINTSCLPVKSYTTITPDNQIIYKFYKTIRNKTQIIC